MSKYFRSKSGENGWSTTRKHDAPHPSYLMLLQKTQDDNQKSGFFTDYVFKMCSSCILMGRIVWFTFMAVRTLKCWQAMFQNLLNSHVLIQLTVFMPLHLVGRRLGSVVHGWHMRAVVSSTWVRLCSRWDRPGAGSAQPSAGSAQPFVGVWILSVGLTHDMYF